VFPKADALSPRLCPFWLGLSFCLLAAGALGQELKPPATPAELQQRLADFIGQPRFAAALWGVKVISLESGQTLFEHNAQKLFSPASNTKLYTAALALDRLGADFRIKTSLYASVKPDQSGTLEGDLVIYGRGDPGINPHFSGGDLIRAVAPLVTALTNAGVKHVAGGLVGDASFFRGPPFGAGWAWDDAEHAYGAGLSALTINDNLTRLLVRPGRAIGVPCLVTLSPSVPGHNLSNRTETAEQSGTRTIHLYRQGSAITVSGRMPLGAAAYTEEIPVSDPASLFLSVFNEALARYGVTVAGSSRCLNWLDRQAETTEATNGVELGSMASAPLRDLIRETLKTSQNLYANLLLSQVGERARAGRLDATSEALGIGELNQFLAAIGIKKGDVFFEEGSGLSRNNLATPDATVALLQYMSRHKQSEIFLRALPVAGVDGTLADRMKGTPAAGNVRAKTGSLRWAHSLSGYVTSAAGERLAFSFMLNRYHGSSAAGTADLDSLAVLLAGFGGHSAP
jgi:serine-type D-Ala-D-Ala carboxypeptidase/endopeptidase (penicillin-binding protein 4)